MFKTLLYIQISDQRLRVTSPQLANSYESTPCVAIDNSDGKKLIVAVGREAEALRGKPNVEVINPFGHPRLVLSDSTVGEKLLQHAIYKLFEGKLRLSKRVALIHPERELEGGLTPVEHQSLAELCKNAGCGETTVYQGRPLTMDELRAR